MIEHLLTDSGLLVTRTQTGTPDRYGTKAWVEESVEVAVWYHPVTSEELALRPAGTVSHLVYLSVAELEAAGVDPDTTSRIVIDGRSLEFAGPPRRWRRPQTGAEFLVADALEQHASAPIGS